MTTLQVKLITSIRNANGGFFKHTMGIRDYWIDDERFYVWHIDVSGNESIKYFKYDFGYILKYMNEYIRGDENEWIKKYDYNCNKPQARRDNASRG